MGAAGRTRSRTATGGGSSPRCSSTAACSTSRSTCSPSTGSARSSSRRSARRASCSSTSSRASRDRRERSGSAPQFAVTVGASGAIFGLIGALLILEYLSTGSLMGQAMVLILVNLALTFAVPGISIGGHLGGLAGGIVATYALMRYRGPRAALLGIASPPASASPASRSPTRACAATSPERSTARPLGRTTSDDAVDPHDVDGDALRDRAARPRSGRSSAPSRPRPGRAGPAPPRSGSRRRPACRRPSARSTAPAASGSSAAAAACA